MLSTLTMRSELLALRDLSNVVFHQGYAVQTTPDEPDYWMGNQVIVTDPDMTAAQAISAFETHLSFAKHRAIVWDIAGLDPEPIKATFDPLGYEADTFDTLVLDTEIAPATLPNGLVIRLLDGDADWAASHQLQCEIGQEEGRPAESHSIYLAKRKITQHTQKNKGYEQWYGDFENDHMMSQMGMMHDHDIARYQSVETRASHRRRGICSALLRHVGLWALDRAPDAKLVIVAEADSAAGRLYRRMGFAHAETLVGVVKPGY